MFVINHWFLEGAVLAYRAIMRGRKASVKPAFFLDKLEHHDIKATIFPL